MISNCGHDESNKYSGGKAGDQTGGEWAVISWYNRPWDWVLLPPSQKAGKLMADLARQAANNNLIGYDQNERTTFWTHLKASGYYPSKITVACEADCSAGVAALAKAVGYLLGNTAMQNISADCYTGNIRKALVAAGWTATQDSKYLSGADYLPEGAVLLYEYHHVATNLDAGKYATSSEASTGSTTSGTTTTTTASENIKKGQKWLNSNYGALITKTLGAKLEVDGGYGSLSRWAALCVWKDLTNRKYNTSLTPSNQNFGETCKTAAKKVTIQQGSSGTYVYLIEFILAARGYYTGAMDADYGSGLVSAVKAYQKSKDLTADGIVGANTWYMLFN